MADPEYRRKIARQLNKGESLHALRRDLLYAHEGMIRARQLADQTEQAWCLTLPPTRSARRATGRCGCVTPCSDRSRRYPRARFVCSRPSHSVVVISGIRSAQDRPSCVQSWSQARG
nr:Tn3 family transposase [Nocardia cyriacigeorgica]